MREQYRIFTDYQYTLFENCVWDSQNFIRIQHLILFHRNQMQRFWADGGLYTLNIWLSLLSRPHRQHRGHPSSHKDYHAPNVINASEKYERMLPSGGSSQHERSDLSSFAGTFRGKLDLMKVTLSFRTSNFDFSRMYSLDLIRQSARVASKSRPCFCAKNRKGSMGGMREVGSCADICFKTGESS